MISLDLSLLFQIIGFFILLVILNRFLYGPVLKVLKEREEKIGGTIKGAANLEKEVQEGIVSYEKRLKEAAVKGHEERNKLRVEALEKEKAMLEAARNEAAGELARIRVELEASKTSAITGLKTESKALSKSIAEKVLERTITVALLVLLPSIALASESAHGGGSAIYWKIFNFIVLAVGVYLVWTKVLSGMLEKRGEDIKKAINEAKSAKDAADLRAVEYREKLSRLETRIEEIQKELRLEGEAEKKRMIAEAENASVRVKEQAKLAAEQEIKKAKLEIRKEAANLAVQMAEEILKKELSPADQERLVKGYLNNLRLN